MSAAIAGVGSPRTPSQITKNGEVKKEIVESATDLFEKARKPRDFNLITPGLCVTSASGSGADTEALAGIGLMFGGWIAAAYLPVHPLLKLAIGCVGAYAGLKIIKSRNEQQHNKSGCTISKPSKGG